MVHGIVLYCIALHCIALHCIALHCIIYFYASTDSKHYLLMLFLESISSSLSSNVENALWSFQRIQCNVFKIGVILRTKSYHTLNYQANVYTANSSSKLHIFGVNSQPNRGITVVSRLGKRKSCKSVRRRFFRVKGGLLKRWRAGKVHKMRKKSSWRRFRLRGSVLVKNKSQLKTLNKMLYKQ